MELELELKDKAISISAKRGSGKSELTKYIINLFRDDFQKIYVICPSEGVNHFYSTFIPKENIFQKYEEKWCMKLMDKMEKINCNLTKDKRVNVLLVLDDCCSDVKFHQSDSLKRIFTRGRHCNLAVIIISQYIYQVPPVCRSNADYILVSQMNRQGVDILTSEYLMGNISKDDFMKMYYRNTSNYGFLLISNSSASDNNNLDEIYGNITVPKEFFFKK